MSFVDVSPSTERRLKVPSTARRIDGMEPVGSDIRIGRDEGQHGRHVGSIMPDPLAQPPMTMAPPANFTRTAASFLRVSVVRIAWQRRRRRRHDRVGPRTAIPFAIVSIGRNLPMTPVEALEQIPRGWRRVGRSAGRASISFSPRFRCRHWRNRSLPPTARCGSTAGGLRTNQRSMRVWHWSSTASRGAIKVARL